MCNEKDILPSYKSYDRMISSWDYDEYGRWGQKQYIRCFLSILLMYFVIFYPLYYLWWCSLKV